MKTLLFYPDTPSAHIAKSVLAAHDIDAFVADENLANTDPPVVFATGGVRLMVAEEDIAQAQEILRNRAKDFELPDDWEPPGEEVAVSEALPSTEPPVPVSRFSVFLMGLLLGGGLGALGYKSMVASQLQPVVAHDLNADGTADNWFHYADGSAFATLHEADRNDDGAIDSRVRFDERGNATTAELDNDFDGTFETTQEWRSPLYMVEKIVRLHDDLPDIEFVYEQGFKGRQLWRNSEGRTVKRATYEHGVKTGEEWDQDGDGMYERIIRFDAFENPVAD